jgi:phosphoribosylformylglycinamidine cyclo-ligase
MSHITGSGIPGNLPRVLPEDCGARLDGRWHCPSIFPWLARCGDVDEREMRRTFNMGIGFVVVLPPTDVARAADVLRAVGESPVVVGRVIRVPTDRPFEERVEWEA